MNKRLGAFVVLGVIGLFGVAKAVSSSSNNNLPTPVTLQNHTVSGNIVNDLKSENSGTLTTTSKTIQKFNVDKKRIVYFNSQFTAPASQAAVTKLKELEAKSNDPIWLLIDSPGGSVIDGGALISQMEASRAPIYTVCTRLCASMAAMTHSYGSKRFALDRALLMYHPASASGQGQVKNMLSLFKTIDRYVNKMNSNVVKRSKLTPEEYNTLVAYEIWIDSEDALNKGLIDGIVNLDVTSYESSSFNQEEAEENKTKPRRRIEIEMISEFDL